MPFTQIMDSLANTCRYCGQKAGVLRRNHQDCEKAFQAGWQEMVSIVTQAATDHSFNESTLRQSLSDVANRSRATDGDIERALEAGWRQSVTQAMTDGIISRDEEERLRAFRDRLALENSTADPGSVAELDRASADRVMLEARLAAISVRDGDGHLRDPTLSIRQVNLGPDEANRLLIRA
jgi:hypothetical protein